MKSVKFLIELQNSRGLNDAATAKLLNLTAPAISQYKSGKRVMDDETCLALALELKVDPLQVIGAACIDRAEKSGQKSLWEVFMARTAATAALVLLASGVNLFLTPGNAEAATMRDAGKGIAGNIDYAKFVRRLRRRRSATSCAVRTWLEWMFMPGALLTTAR